MPRLGEGTTIARGAFEGDSDHIHLEFDSDETVDHFGTSWWSDFKNAVDRSDIDAAFRIDGHPAIVTGLLGIDWAHTPGAESHPVWALAIKITEGQWAFFVRNWGNEGFCSSQQHYLEGLPGNAYKFKLPWPPRATDVSILPPEIHSEGIRFPVVTFSVIKNEEVDVSFHLPPPGFLAFYDGTINLSWTFPPETSPPPPPPPPDLPHCNKVVHINCGDEPEGNAARVLGPMLTDGQKAVIAADLKERGTARLYEQTASASILKSNAIHIERLDHVPPLPTAGPTTRAVFDEKHERRDKLQLAELCAAFRGTIPNFPKACARFFPAAERPSKNEHKELH